MSIKELIKLIVQNTQKINDLHEAIHRTFKNKMNDEQAWKHATKQFHHMYDTLAFPGGLEEGLISLKKSDPTTINYAIAYLAANPYCFRSGYIKEKIAHILKKVSLSAINKQHIQQILITVAPTIDQRTWKSYCRLARTIVDADFLLQLDNAIRTTTEPFIRKRLETMKAICTKQ